MTGKNAICLMTAVVVGMGFVGRALLRWVWPQYDFAAYPLIPLVFLLTTLIIILLEIRWERGVACGRTTQQRVVVNLMGAKMAKLLLSLILVFLYWRFWGEQVRPFIVVFSTFYLVCLVLETRVFVSLTKRYAPKKR
ncbi:MAG: hypothetical protein FWE10_07295 [Rikenellaceae bacterium]|nr:hypothetical protein [Rikenellaceae bacterium]MCL2693237.1 hypothetical protein [Rikenellaceae bacterium]